MAQSFTARFTSPLGVLAGSFTPAGALAELNFADAEAAAGVAAGWLESTARAVAVQRPEQLPPAIAPAAQRLALQLSEYFSRTRRSFDITLAPEGTAFQLAVWDELTRIPWGRTLSYAELARRVDARLVPTAAEAAGLHPAAQPGGSLRIRAVGRANALNSVAILIPCHRVIGSDGRLTGYAGGLWRKQALLELEGVLTPRLC